MRQKQIKQSPPHTELWQALSIEKQATIYGGATTLNLKTSTMTPVDAETERPSVGSFVKIPVQIDHNS